MPRSGITGSYGNSIFSFLKEFYLSINCRIYGRVAFKYVLGNGRRWTQWNIEDFASSLALATTDKFLIFHG